MRWTGQIAGPVAAQVDELTWHAVCHSGVRLQRLRVPVSRLIRQRSPRRSDCVKGDLAWLLTEHVAVPGSQPDLIPIVGIEQPEQPLRLTGIG